MTSTTYIIPIRLQPAQRTKHGKGFTYTPKEYREAQRELRETILTEIGPFETIEPAKKISAAPSKGRAERPAFRNIVLDYELRLVGHSAGDVDNFDKLLQDTLGPWSDRNLLKKDQDLHARWVPLYRNDRQIIGGTRHVFEHQPYNELRLTITELAAPMQPQGDSND